MNSPGEIEDHIFSKMLVKEGFIMDYIQVVIDELLPECSVTAFDNAVDLGTPRTDKQMRDIGFSECLIKCPEILSAVVRLPVFDLKRIQGAEPLAEVLHVPAG